jgi:hypothetical protein
VIEGGRSRPQFQGDSVLGSPFHFWGSGAAQSRF